jgi:hypothetical protein
MCIYLASPLPHRLCLGPPFLPTLDHFSLLNPLQVQKSYDFDYQKYYCPEPNPTPTATPSTDAPTTGGTTTAPVASGTQPLTIEMDVSGELPPQLPQPAAVPRAHSTSLLRTAALGAAATSAAAG